MQKINLDTSCSLDLALYIMFPCGHVGLLLISCQCSLRQPVFIYAFPCHFDSDFDSVDAGLSRSFKVSIILLNVQERYPSPTS